MAEVYVDEAQDVTVIKSTYKDNPFLGKDYVQMLENSIN
ncbi:unnamed protein product, partial [marine sediment metagenome]